ncbi:hypothetical protein BB776_02960 [Planococcus salinarum]|uniref:Copper amine oxidase n=1 Tax=Planococcus salinarum TaxID=622695 RepID=A0ABX3D1V7_9BACL|nr:hypothetical protein [Planococcus salinarum]OHX51821.1 hypothetical protein BB776_02960 [Planococcus salinarum]TAA73418.1 hypothetical protein D2909_00800 [Planococcus salinarum]
MKFRKILAPILGTALLVPSMGMAVNAEEGSPVETSGVELRATLDSLLSEHYALAVDSMMKIYDGDAAAEAAMAALDANAADMEPVIASVYGEEGGAAFTDIFDKHNTGTDEYAMAVKAGDEAAQEEALVEIQSFVDEMGAFLGTATEGNLPEDGATDALRAHEDFVQNTFDLYVDGDYEASYTSYLEGFKQIFGAGSAISGAIATQFPDKFTDPNTEAGDFRSTLSRIAAEHFALAQLSMAKGYNGAADFDFADWAQDQNTAEFQAAIASVYGEEAGTQFAGLWNNDHISIQSDLATAQAAGNEDDIQQAQSALIDTFAEELGAFLSTATEDRLPQDETTANIAAHEQSVVDTFSQYAAGDYEASYTTYREGYTIVFAIGKGLSGAIVDQFPENFETAVPDKMPATGLGGSTGGTNTMMIWVAMSTLILLAAGTITYRQRQQ